MKRLLVATHNPAKIDELKFGLKQLENRGIEVVTLNDVRVEEEPEETGATFKDNALLKARFYSKKTGLPTLSDDGGLVIPHLNNEPGVKSSRWLGRKATDHELIVYTLKRLQGVPHKERGAYLELYLCYYDPVTKNSLFENERIYGHMETKPFDKYKKGFPYRALLVVDRFNKYYDDLSEDEHQIINHRLIALKRLTKRISDLIILDK
jgi:XTP/dITP diphosphohydrolase